MADITDQQPPLPDSQESETALAVIIPQDSVLRKLLDTRKGASKEKLPVTLEEVRGGLLKKQFDEDVALFHRALAVYDREMKALGAIRADLEPEFDENGKELLPKRFTAKQNKLRGEQKTKVNALVAAINKAGDEANPEQGKLLELLKKYEGSTK